ncbi:MAG: cytochrome c [Chitinophagaceae bacterium]|nr:cytochrome c [Chitinophagaceae bacterium]MCW5905150.1 cytochrome c [Chitinophagaceae bacterium]
MSDRAKVMTLIILLISFFCYTLFLYKENYSSNAEYGSIADKGKRLWQEKNCNSCHQIYGLGGYLGPDLTNVYSQRSEVYIKAFLQAGTNVMPNFHLTEEQMNEIMAYFKSIDSSGYATPAKLKTNYDGTIER